MVQIIFGKNNKSKQIKWIAIFLENDEIRKRKMIEKEIHKWLGNEVGENNGLGTQFQHAEIDMETSSIHKKT